MISTPPQPGASTIPHSDDYQPQPDSHSPSASDHNGTAVHVAVDLLPPYHPIPPSLPLPPPLLLLLLAALALALLQLQSLNVS